MLTLLPLSGIQDVFRRRNSTTMEQFADRRGSISVYDTYSLPNSKADLKRFSSYEQLAPFFQQILSSDSVPDKMSPAPTLVPVSPSTNSASSTSPSPTVPSPLVRSRRGSVSRFASALTGSFRRHKSLSTKTATESASEVSCDDLDKQLAKIKTKLAQFKTEDVDISQRVEDLSSSVEELYASTPECCSPLSSQDRLYYRLRQEKMQMQRSNSFQNYRSCLSGSGLQSISENNSEDEKDEPDRVSFRSTGEVCLRRSPPVQGPRPSFFVSMSKESELCALDKQDKQDNVSYRPSGEALVCLRCTPPVQRSRPSSYASISEEPELTAQEPTYVDDTANTKAYCLLNNTAVPDTRHRAKSMTQLPHLIRNDLSRHRGDTSKRNSVTSIMSDSILITHRHLPALQPFLKEHAL